MKIRKQSVWAFLIAAILLLLPLSPAQAQYRDRHGNFYNGAYGSGRGGRGYYDRGRDYHGHGIGTGKGALIGGAGGAALGALFGGGMKGALIGGAAGAGIGAIAGHEHQKTVRRNDYYRGRY